MNIYNERQSRRERAAFSCDSERESASSACYINLNHARKSVENSALFLLFAYFFFFYRNKEEKVREFFEIKSFLKCPFLSLLLRRKRERKERKERENTLPLPTLLRAFNQMDVASRACTLTLAIGATHVNILSASINKIQNSIFSIQACLKVTFHVRTHARGANVVRFLYRIKFFYKIKNLYIDIKIM